MQQETVPASLSIAQLKSSAALTSVLEVLAFRTAVFFRRLDSFLAISNPKLLNSSGVVLMFSTVQLFSGFRSSRFRGML